MRARRWVWLLFALACDGPGPSGPGPEVPPVVEEILGGNGVRDITSALGRTFAVGDQGLVMSSVDGLRWTNHPTGFLSSLMAVAYSGTRFVAVGGDPVSLFGGEILVSTDGVQWTARSVPAFSVLYGVVWTGTQFVAVGANGTIITSPDGLVWTLRLEQPGAFLMDVAWSGSRIVAAGHLPTAGVLLSSVDGVTWSLEHEGDPGDINAVIWTGTEFVAGGSTVLKSADGLEWSQAAFVENAVIQAIAWTGEKFVGVTSSSIYDSPDGEAWNMLRGWDAVGHAAHWDGTRLWAGGSRGQMTTWAPGSEWTRVVSPASHSLLAVARSPQRLVAVGAFGVILTSTDGRSWTSLPPVTTHGLNDVVWAGNQFVAVSNAFDGVNQAPAQSLRSADGLTWTVHETAYPYPFRAVAWSPQEGRLVAVGAEQSIYSSVDGIAWTEHVYGQPGVLVDVTWMGSRFFVSDHASRILRSEAGGWVGMPLGSEPYRFVRIAASADRVVALGESNAFFHRRAFVSTDGGTFTELDFPGPTNHSGFLAWTGSRFVRMDRFTAHLSPDGAQWTEVRLFLETAPALHDATDWLGQIVVVGTDGTLIVLR